MKMKYIFLIVAIFLITYYYIKYKENTDLKITINCVKPIKLLPQRKRILLNPVDVEYYNKLKNMREQLKEKRIKNYNMNKGTINNEVAEIPEGNNIEFEYVELRIPEEINLNNFNNDAQNVHDSTVQDTIRVKFGKINNNNNNNKEFKINEIIEYAKKKKIINGKFREERLLFILEAITKRNSPISNLGDATELDVLKMVWGEERLRDQIINELFDCYNGEYNYIVCPTGVVTRLLNADVVLNPESTPRTIEVLRVEMLNLAAQIRNDCEKMDDYLKKTGEEQDVYLKERIKERINESYKGILSSETIQKELDTWLDVI